MKEDGLQSADISHKEGRHLMNSGGFALAALQTEKGAIAASRACHMLESVISTLLKADTTMPPKILAENKVLMALLAFQGNAPIAKKK